MTMRASCCLKAFEWEGIPTGRVEKLGVNNTYVAGTSSTSAILLIHDALGWTFPNARLLADAYAKETGATVYLPDFFAGEVLPFEPILKGRWDEIDFPAFLGRNSREIREPEILAAARELRGKYAKVGAVGFCWGGWAAFRLASKSHQPALVDCIVVGHPSLTTKADIDDVSSSIPIQILAPEHDFVFTAEMKSYAFETLQKLNVPFEYHHFPGMEHGSLVRGDQEKVGERAAMERALAAAVGWLGGWLK